MSTVAVIAIIAPLFLPAIGSFLMGASTTYFGRGSGESD